MQENDVVTAAGTLWSIRYPIAKRCQVCHAQSTPCWRRSENHTELCNRCGIRASVARKKRSIGEANRKSDAAMLERDQG